MDRFIGFRVMAAYDGRDQDEIERAIRTALGCDDHGDEVDCPMVTLSSCTGPRADVTEFLDIPKGLPE